MNLEDSMRKAAYVVAWRGEQNPGIRLLLLGSETAERGGAAVAVILLVTIHARRERAGDLFSSTQLLY